MVKGRKSRATLVNTRKSVIPNTTFDSPAPSRKRLGETLSVRTKKIRVEYEEIFNQFKKIHDEELSSTVLSLGTGDAGQLGLGDTFLERKRPFPVKDLTDIIKICAGGMHNVCLSKSGKVYSFGCNDDFALGRPIVEDEESMVPGQVIIPTSSDIIDITAGDSHSAALTSDGKVFIWGSFRDNASVIGLLKPSERVADPIEIFTTQKIVKIASGENHFAMLTNTGEILTFGCAEQGQLGRIREVYLMRGGKSGLNTILTAAPARVKNHVRFNDIWAGSYCTIAKSTDGDLYGCGLNNWTQLGLSKGPEDNLSACWMTKLDKFNNLGLSWKMFMFGLHHTLALTEEGLVYVIGRGDYGNLGLGDREHKDEVTLLSTLTGKVTSIAACGHVSYALKEDGSAWSWGCGNTYQLGYGDDDDAIEPGMVEGKFLKDMKVVEVSVGGQHVIFRAVNKNDKSDDFSVITEVKGTVEVGSKDPIEFGSKYPVEVESKDTVEVESKYPVEVESKYPVEIESKDLKDQIEVTIEDPMVSQMNVAYESQDNVQESNDTKHDLPNPIEPMEVESLEH